MSPATALGDARSARGATGGDPRILRAPDLARELGSAWPALAEPVYFVATRLARSWPELGGDVAWIDPRSVPTARWAPAENIWVVSTYLRLRRRGLDVRIVDRLVPGAINVCHDDEAIRAPDSHRAFVVVAQADRLYLDWGEYTLAQSPAIAARPRTCLIDHWPQPGLLARDPDRGTAITRIGYTGSLENLARPFRGDSFRRSLESIGVEFAVRTDPATWHDFHDLDLHLAIRKRTRVEMKTKPATKLVHSWITECPGLLGNEPAFRYWGAPGSDYIEVTSPGDVLSAVRRLREDPSLYRSLQVRGREKAVGHDEEGVCRQWAAVLSGPVRREFEAWRDDAGRADRRRRARRAWQRFAAPLSRKFFYLRIHDWDQIRKRILPLPRA